MPQLFRRLVAAALLTLTLAGCASMDNFGSVRPGVSTGAEVLSRYGPAKQIWPEADGGKTLEYSSQPFGQTCFMVTVDAKDRVTRIEDALQLGNRSRIEPGMTPEQVSRMLGKERSRVGYKFSGEEVWDWTIERGQTSYVLRFHVHFIAGRVVRYTESMVFPSKFGPGLD